VGVSIDDLLKTPKNPEWMKYSIEFCGGTHLESTKPIEMFAITQEESIGKGIRRLVAITGDSAKKAFSTARDFGSKLEEVEKTQKYETLTNLLKELNDLEIPASYKIQYRDKIEKLQKAKRQVSKKDEGDQQKAIEQLVSETISKLSSSGDSYYVGEVSLANGQSAVMVDFAKRLNEKLPNVAILLISSAGPQKVTITAKVPPSILSSKSLKANKWAAEAAIACGGKGGGKDDTAAGSGNDASKIGAAIEKAVNFAKQNL
jgi:alanyl-tRNA synthetase